MTITSRWTRSGIVRGVGSALAVVSLLGVFAWWSSASSVAIPMRLQEEPDEHPPSAPLLPPPAVHARARPIARAAPTRPQRTVATPGVLDAGRAAHTPSQPARGALLTDDSSRSAPPGQDRTTGSLDPAAVSRGIQAAKPKIASCYERALVIEPELAGKVVVEFRIERNADDDVAGTVTAGEVVETEMSSPFFEACVLQEVAGTPFDAPSGGPITVRYPFHFRSAPNDAP